jgi:hypothetical protein
MREYWVRLSAISYESGKVEIHDEMLKVLRALRGLLG